MNLHERQACDGLADDAPISASMEWLREHWERLAWEPESAGAALAEARAELRKKEGAK